MDDSLLNFQAKASGCAFHRFITDLCPPGSRNIKIRKVGTGQLTINDESRPVLSICRAQGDESSTSNPFRVPGDVRLGLPVLPRSGSPAQFEIIRRWLEDCDKNHDGCTREAVSTTPTRLIDVSPGAGPETVRLCETAKWGQDQHDRRYIALSHPWGDPSKNDHFCTTTGNVAERLSAGMRVAQLPPTFRHAVLVTRELGLQYVWIDSLCIIQGDDGDFDTEAKHMESVFSAAYCVVAASRAGGTSSGFLGERPERRFVRFDRASRGGPFFVCQAIDNFQEDVINGKLNKRGWVLQERALARRTVYFTEKQVYWECGLGVRCETLTRMQNNQAAFLGDPDFPRLAGSSSRGGRIHVFTRLYEQYSSLEFSRMYDRPIAIAGLEQRLVRAFDTHGGYGIFDGDFFGRSLLWQRDGAKTAVMKAIAFPPTQRYRVPTWSWMAYEGAINFISPPFGGTRWGGDEDDKEEDRIRSPWAAGRGVSTTRSAWHTGDAETDIVLTGKARSFDADRAGGLITYDRGERPAGGRAFKCVIVGRQERKWGVETDPKQKHYCLIVIPRLGTGQSGAYERIGAGCLLYECIEWDSPAIRVRII